MGSHSLSPSGHGSLKIEELRNGMTRNDSYDHQVNHFHNSLPGESLHHELGLIVFVSVKHAGASYGSVSFRDSSFRAVSCAIWFRVSIGRNEDSKATIVLFESWTGGVPCRVPWIQGVHQFFLRFGSG